MGRAASKRSCQPSKLFWTPCDVLLQAVEATAEATHLTYKADIHDRAHVVLPIQDYVVVLPTIVNPIHGQDKWQGEHVTELFGDHSLWTAESICSALLPHFFYISKAKPLPELAEYAWRLDKVRLFA